MRNLNKPIPKIDDRPKSIDEVKGMLDRLMSTDEDGNPEDSDKNSNKVIA